MAELWRSAKEMNPKKLPKEIFYARGIIRNRLEKKGFYYRDDAALELLGDAYTTGVSLDAINDIVRSLKVKTWTSFRDAIIDATDLAISKK